MSHFSQFNKNIYDPLGMKLSETGGFPKGFFILKSH